MVGESESTVHGLQNPLGCERGQGAGNPCFVVTQVSGERIDASCFPVQHHFDDRPARLANLTV